MHLHVTRRNSALHHDLDSTSDYLCKYTLQGNNGKVGLPDFAADDV